MLTAVVKTCRREDGCAVVEEVVGTSQLLTGLQDHTKHGTVKHARASEDLVPWVVATGGFSFKLVLDFLDFGVDESRVLCHTVEASHVAASFFDAALSVCETRGLGQKQNGATEDDGPQSRQAVRDAPLSTVVVVLGRSVVDHVRGPDTQGDEQLVRGDGGATNALGDRLGLVHGNDSGKGTNAKTGSEATHSELYPDVLASDLNDNTNNVPESRARDGQTATEGIRERSRTQASKECTDTEFMLDQLDIGGHQVSLREKTDNCSLADGREFSVFAKAGNEVVHGKETRDLTGFVAEHETTNTGNGSQDDCDSRHTACRLLYSSVGVSPRGSLRRSGSIGYVFLSHLVGVLLKKSHDGIAVGVSGLKRLK